MLTGNRGWPAILGRNGSTAMIAAMAAAAVSACNLQISNEAEARDEWKKSYTVAAGATIEIRNGNGQVTVDASDSPTIDVTVVRIVHAPTDEAAKAALEQFAIESSASADRIVLDTQTRTVGFTGLSRSANFTVRVPNGVNVVARSVNGNVKIAGVTGTLRATSTNGNLTAAGVPGGEFESINGSIDLDLTQLGDAGVSCETTNGTTTITVARDARARLSVRAINSGIDTSGLTLGDRSEPSHGRLEATLNGGGPALRITSTNGVVRLRGR
jgi:hypothetical protein